MKKFFVIIAFLLSFCAVSAIEISDTTQTLSEKSFTNSVDAPQYWDGWAVCKGVRRDGCKVTHKLYITVYRAGNLCDSFYAVATKRRQICDGCIGTWDDLNVELVVKKGNKSSSDYFVTYDGIDFHFEM